MSLLAEALTAVRFGIVGIANTLVGLTAIYAFRDLAHFGETGANFAGYTVGLIVSFVLNRAWTFSHRGDVRRAAIRFLLVFAVAYAGNLVVVLAALRAGIDAHLAHALGIAPYVLLSYLGSRLFVFGPRTGVAPDA